MDEHTALQLSRIRSAELWADARRYALARTSTRRGGPSRRPRPLRDR